MEVVECDLAFSLRSLHAHGRFERSQCDAHVAWMGGDALFALTEDGVDTIESFQRSAATARLPFVTLRKSGVIKVEAARALHQIAADGRHVAQLRAGA